MKTMVIGDTHGRINKIIHILIENEQIGHVIHLGDMARDADALMDGFPHLSFTVVEGNNELQSHFPTELLIEISTKKAFVTHGHLYGVKRSDTKLLYRAKELGADFVLFAHTHIKYDVHKEGVTLLNPSNRGYILIGEDGSYDFFDL